MEKCFEDEFMDILSGYVGLCMEFLEISEIKAERIYMGCCIEPFQSFNAFFIINGEVKNLGLIGADDNLEWKLLRIGTEDTDRIVDVCKKYGMEHPHIITMVYDVNTGKFNANQRYDDTVRFDDIMSEWAKKVRNSLG